MRPLPRSGTVNVPGFEPALWLKAAQLAFFRAPRQRKVEREEGHARSGRPRAAPGCGSGMLEALASRPGRLRWDRRVPSDPMSQILGRLASRFQLAARNHRRRKQLTLRQLNASCCDRIGYLRSTHSPPGRGLCALAARPARMHCSVQQKRTYCQPSSEILTGEATFPLFGKKGTIHEKTNVAPGNPGVAGFRRISLGGLERLRREERGRRASGDQHSPLMVSPRRNS